ncbi:DUF4397 domain-containing protein [Natrarchaeobius oligotrophus]|uniref:DUF4397 domain-containing protein n=1 Tax=Natrarchaeobius oligotrophus TaxID=3455743 RepID=UPI0026862F2C
MDGQPVLEDVAFGDVSPYLELAPGTHTVTVTAAGDPETAAIEEELAVESAAYTVTSIGERGAAPASSVLRAERAG